MSGFRQYIELQTNPLYFNLACYVNLLDAINITDPLPCNTERGGKTRFYKLYHKLERKKSLWVYKYSSEINKWNVMIREGK